MELYSETSLVADKTLGLVIENVIAVLACLDKEGLGYSFSNLLEPGYLVLQFYVLLGDQRALKKIQTELNRVVVTNVIAHGVDLLVIKKLGKIGVALEAL